MMGRCACSCGRPWCWRLLRAVTATRSQSRDSVQNGAGACASGGGMFVGLSSRFFADVDSTRRWTWHGRDARVVRVFLFRCATGTDGASCSTDSDADNQGRSSVPITHARHSLDIGSKPARCKRGRSVEHSPHDDASVQPCASLLASCRTKSAIAGAHRPPPPDDSAGEASGGGGRGGGGLRGCGGARACCTAAAASGWGTTWRRRLKMGLRCGSCKYKCGTEIRWSCETVKAVRDSGVPRRHIFPTHKAVQSISKAAGIGVRRSSQSVTFSHSVSNGNNKFIETRKKDANSNQKSVPFQKQRRPSTAARHTRETRLRKISRFGKLR